MFGHYKHLRRLTLRATCQTLQYGSIWVQAMARTLHAHNAVSLAFEATAIAMSETLEVPSIWTHMHGQRDWPRSPNVTHKANKTASQLMHLSQSLGDTI